MAAWVVRPALAVCVVLLAPAAAPAAAQQSIGTTAGVLFELPPAPRPLALGDAYTALADDELALFYNPARLVAASRAVGLAYQTYPFDAGAGSLAAAAPLGPGVAGAGLRFLSLGAVDEMEPDPAFWGQRGRPTGRRVGGSEVEVSGGYGVAVGAGIQLGLAAKLIRRQIADAAATGLAVDAGAGAELWDGRMVLAVAARQVGGALGPGRAAPLPRTIRGAAALRLGGPTGPRAALTAEARLRDGRVLPASGLEVGFAAAPDRSAVARVGYDDRYRGEGTLAPLVVGAGVRSGRLSVDYAYRVLGLLGATHQFGLSLHGTR